MTGDTAYPRPWERSSAGGRWKPVQEAVDGVPAAGEQGPAEGEGDLGREGGHGEEQRSVEAACELGGAVMGPP
ncbi:hypothetical protein SNA_10795 [Streptomyces natalensis ATCC 27448]|uniref:Uncharacterized protein n=1 Tax=Streptomyces natalensis ATCC 27448 TaxID=1240678 RepID=A0A0D7CP31_9ACTN|nr:hypothetical protein SNA_10795 [Streptomyces natalensis ATCC 27448]